MKSKDEIAAILYKIPEPAHMTTTTRCACCGGPRTMGPANDFCFRCHRKGCFIKNNGSKVRKCS